MMRTFILGVLGVLSAITAAANAVLPQTNASANGAEESRQKKADFKDIHITHGPYLHNITPTGATVMTNPPFLGWKSRPKTVRISTKKTGVNSTTRRLARKLWELSIR